MPKQSLFVVTIWVLLAAGVILLVDSSGRLKQSVPPTESDSYCLQSMENFQALQDSTIDEVKIEPQNSALVDTLVLKMFLRAQEITGLCEEMALTRFTSDSVVQTRFHRAKNFVDWVQSERIRKKAPGQSA